MKCNLLYYSFVSEVIHSSSVKEWSTDQIFDWKTFQSTEFPSCTSTGFLLWSRCAVSFTLKTLRKKTFFFPIGHTFQKKISSSTWGEFWSADLRKTGTEICSFVWVGNVLFCHIFFRRRKIRSRSCKIFFIFTSLNHLWTTDFLSFFNTPLNLANCFLGFNWKGSIVKHTIFIEFFLWLL